MLKSGRRKFWIAAGCLLFLAIAVFICARPQTEPLTVTITRTNQFPGVTNVILHVQNNTAQTQVLLIWAQRQTGGKWMLDPGWNGFDDARRFARLPAQTSREILLPPLKAPVWRFHFARRPEPGKFSSKWFSFVMEHDLKSFGLDDGPPVSYSYSEPLSY